MLSLEVTLMVKHPIRTCIIVPGVAALLASCALYVRSDVNHALIGTVHCHTFAWRVRSTATVRCAAASRIR